MDKLGGIEGENEPIHQIAGGEEDLEKSVVALALLVLCECSKIRHWWVEHVLIVEWHHALSLLADFEELAWNFGIDLDL